MSSPSQAAVLPLMTFPSLCRSCHSSSHLFPSLTCPALVLLSATPSTARGLALSSPLGFKNPDSCFFFLCHPPPNPLYRWPMASHCVWQPLCHVWKCQHQHDTVRTLTSGLKVGDMSPHFYVVMLLGIEGPLVITVSEIIGREVCHSARVACLCQNILV